MLGNIICGILLFLIVVTIALAMLAYSAIEEGRREVRERKGGVR